tara:strand:+ start:183497 stop:184276 length:780 start_codon:yes stop_codon:yes gene_type:complete
MSFFYSKNILSKETLQINELNFHCEDIGLCSISKNHNLEYNHVSFTNKVSWEELLFETFDLTFLKLIANKMINVEVVNYEETYLFNFYKHKKRNFVITKGIELEDFDLFSNSVVDTINQLVLRKNKTTYLHEVVIEVFNVFLEEYEKYLKPDKNMLLKILNLYVENNDWLKFEEKHNYFGPLYKYKIQIKPIYIPRLKIQYKDVKGFQKDTLKGNAPYSQFRRRIREVLEFNYTIRNTFHSDRNKRFSTGHKFNIPTNF